jgi:molecular chaperone GrpE (heat shock protein)
MTSISLTSGQLLDIIEQLIKMADNLDDAENYTLAAYYFNMAQQFELLHDKLQDFIPENRVANLVLTAN